MENNGESIIREIKRAMAMLAEGFNKYEMHGVLFEKDGEYALRTYEHEVPEALCIYRMIKCMVDEGWAPIEDIYDEEDTWTCREYDDGGYTYSEAVRMLSSGKVKELKIEELEDLICQIEDGNL